MAIVYHLQENLIRKLDKLLLHHFTYTVDTENNHRVLHSAQEITQRVQILDLQLELISDQIYVFEVLVHDLVVQACLWVLLDRVYIRNLLLWLLQSP